MPSNWSRRFKNHLEKLKSGDVYQVAEVVRNLSLRNRDSGLSSGEKTMLMNARRVLVSELSFSLNTSEEAVEKKLDAVLCAPQRASSALQQEVGFFVAHEQAELVDQPGLLGDSSRAVDDLERDLHARCRPSRGHAAARRAAGHCDPSGAPP